MQDLLKQSFDQTHHLPHPVRFQQLPLSSPDQDLASANWPLEAGLLRAAFVDVAVVHGAPGNQPDFDNLRNVLVPGGLLLLTGAQPPITKGSTHENPGFTCNI